MVTFGIFQDRQVETRSENSNVKFKRHDFRIKQTGCGESRVFFFFSRSNLWTPLDSLEQFSLLGDFQILFHLSWRLIINQYGDLKKKIGSFFFFFSLNELGCSRRC